MRRTWKVKLESVLMNFLNTSLSLSLKFNSTMNYTTILEVRQEFHFSFIEHPVVQEFITSVEIRLVGNRSTSLDSWLRKLYETLSTYEWRTSLWRDSGKCCIPPPPPLVTWKTDMPKILNYFVRHHAHLLIYISVFLLLCCCLCMQETFLRRYEATSCFFLSTSWTNTSGLSINKT